MSVVQIILLCVGLIAAIGFMYFILPRISKSNENSGKWLRLIIFTAIATYLGYDFYQKAKYGFLIILVLGSAAFLLLLFAQKKK
jgi:hypothetical protein